MPRLIFRRSGDRADAVQEFELPQGEVVVGRAADADMTLDNQTVSRHHAVISCTTQGFVLTDSSSANGTWVNRRRITSVVLRHGDTVGFGTVAAVFDDPPDPNATLMVDVAALLDEAETPQAVGGTPSAAASGAAETSPEPPPSPDLPPIPPPVVEVSTPTGRKPAEPSPAPPPPADIPLEPPPAGASVGEARVRHSPRPAPPPRVRRPPSAPARVAGSSAARPARQAGFWIRVVATLLDGAVLGLASVALWAGGAALATLAGGRAPAVEAFVVLTAGGLATLLPPLYLVIGWARSGRTLGKMACGLRVRREDGGELAAGIALVRLLGYLISSATLGIGYLMVAFTDRKRGLHDMIAGTVVVRDRG